MAEKDVKKETKPEEFQIDGINPEDLSDDLKPLYKSMQADYIKKTEALAEERKSFDTSTASLREEHDKKLTDFGALQQEVNQWRGWYKDQRKDEQVDDKTDPTDTGVDYDTEPGEKKYAQMSEELNKLKDHTQGLEQRLQQSSEEVGRMFKYQDELNDLKTSHPDIDKQQIIEHMLKQGIKDPQVAYKEVYQDDIIESKVKAEVEIRLKEAEEKRKADVITGPGSQIRGNIAFKTPKDMKPRTWEEAEDEVIKDHLSKEMGLI